MLILSASGAKLNGVRRMRRPFVDPTPHAIHCMRTSAYNNDDNDNDIWPVLVTVYRRVTRTDKRETRGKGKRPSLARVPRTYARFSRTASGLVGFIISPSLHPSLFFYVARHADERWCGIQQDFLRPPDGRWFLT